MSETETKTCSKCQVAKGLNEFHKSGSYVQSWCKSCRSDLARAYRKNPETRQRIREKNRKWYFDNKDPRKARRSNLQKYGLSLEEYDSLLSSQAGRCAICESDKTGVVTTNNFWVDHCHRTGHVRGLLCKRCNIGLGEFMDSPEILQKAIAYLQNPPAQLKILASK